eukprot:5554945-Pleurochrysis_carterae.AAC.4
MKAKSYRARCGRNGRAGPGGCGASRLSDVAEGELEGLLRALAEGDVVGGDQRVRVVRHELRARGDSSQTLRTRGRKRGREVEERGTAQRRRRRRRRRRRWRPIWRCSRRCGAPGDTWWRRRGSSEGSTARRRAALAWSPSSSAPGAGSARGKSGRGGRPSPGESR